MDWTTPPGDQPLWSPPEPAAESSSAPSRLDKGPTPRPFLGGVRRTIGTALLAVGLLAVGGVAVVNAADPSASPTPNATTQPSTGAGGSNGTAPDGSARPGRPAPNGQAPSGRAGHDCPNMGGSGTGSQGSG